ncbi:MAG TPA: alpha/beta fold hydrolase [Jiangellaceae bacterium]|nr:alpha/beta fold hydrolase [Jiangellaceae bacterium]
MSTTVVDEHVVAGDRRVEYCLYHRGATRRALFQYGTPGTRWLSPQLIDAARPAGFELLVNRPSRLREDQSVAGRRIVDVVDDVRTVLESLGWDRFAVWGGSGGAPHALAIAALLSDHVTACASVVGLAPYDAAGLDWYAGMSAGNVAEFQAAAQGERAYRPLVERLAADAMASVEAGGIQVAGDYQLPEVDRRALTARHQEDGYLQRMRLTYRDGVDGWVDDCFALTQPWGFDLSELTTPTSVWYGTADVLAAQDHHEYLLATTPGAQRQELRGGHVLTGRDLAAIYDWLADPSR